MNLITLTKYHQGIKSILMPKPGCNNGKRDWETEVKPILDDYYDTDDRIIICDLN